MNNEELAEKLEELAMLVASGGWTVSMSSIDQRTEEIINDLARVRKEAKAKNSLLADIATSAFSLARCLNIEERGNIIRECVAMATRMQNKGVPGNWESYMQLYYPPDYERRAVDAFRGLARELTAKKLPSANDESKPTREKRTLEAWERLLEEFEAAADADPSLTPAKFGKSRDIKDRTTIEKAFQRVEAARKERAKRAEEAREEARKPRR